MDSLATFDLASLARGPRDVIDLADRISRHHPGDYLRVVCHEDPMGFFVLEGNTRLTKAGELQIGGHTVAVNGSPASHILDMPEMFQLPFGMSECSPEPGDLVRAVLYENPAGLFEVVGTVSARRQFIAVSQWVLGTKDQLVSRVREIELVAIAAENPTLAWNR